MNKDKWSKLMTESSLHDERYRYNQLVCNCGHTGHFHSADTQRCMCCSDMFKCCMDFDPQLLEDDICEIRSRNT